MKVFRIIWRLIIGLAATTDGTYLLQFGDDASMAGVALGIALVAVGVSILADAI